MTDEQLLEAWRDGDASCGHALLERHFGALFRFFANKVSEDADDLIQKTMMRAVRGRDQFRGQSSFRSYLFVIARRELLRHYRSRQRDRLVFDPATSSVFDLAGSPSSMAAKNQEQKLLLDGLRRLPLDLQITLELHYWEDLTTAELAGILEIPQGTVKSRLRRAREALVVAIEQLTDDPKQRRETLDNLDRWAREVRAQAR